MKKTVLVVLGVVFGLVVVSFLASQVSGFFWLAGCSEPYEIIEPKDVSPPFNGPDPFEMGEACGNVAHVNEDVSLADCGNYCMVNARNRDNWDVNDQQQCINGAERGYYRTCKAN